VETKDTLWPPPATRVLRVKYLRMEVFLGKFRKCIQHMKKAWIVTFPD
jgi:hypothetical protein